MPTCYGKMALVSVQCFINQTYENRELIVLDNNDEGNAIESLIPKDDRIQYYRVDKMPIGALRNLGNSYATGDLLCNWDCDDWYADTRLEEQVKRLEDSGKALTGWDAVLYFDVSNNSTYKYWYEPQGRNHPPYAMGTSHLVTREWWAKHPYPETGVEDYPFQLAALHANQLDSCDAKQLCVARAHAGSLSFPTQLGRHRQFPAVYKDELPKEFYQAIAPKVTASKATKPKKQKTQESN